MFKNIQSKLCKLVILTLSVRSEAGLRGLWIRARRSPKDTREIYAENERNVTRSNVTEESAVLADLDSREAINLEAKLVQVVASGVCEKGMLAFLTQDLPYPVTYPSRTLNFPYPCDAFTDGGGWIVIQRRAKGDVDFNRAWDDYKNGFGSFAGDFWLGNEKIYTITKSGEYELRIDMAFNGKSDYAHYDSFSIESEDYTETTEEYDSRYYRTRSRTVSLGYRLSIGNYDGTAGDSLRVNNGRPFSTSDIDRDTSTGNCAEEYNGGWWFMGCGYSCLNGKWGAGSKRGAEWRDLTGGLSVSFSEMKIRRVS
ncbi:fibrinogen C domain-containing protein 1 [Elysia marginata]|uniref:Fibrinogen C domain-containing protein 1 n=1 Tax=Elysia marginata TaxID=1093978 RepID=A0AAV4FUL7_9GAST|nr:fibrinogen C domain-containing protein 1 [Elysia marginata]